MIILNNSYKPIDPKKYNDVEQNFTVSVGDEYKTTMYYYQKKVSPLFKLMAIHLYFKHNFYTYPKLSTLLKQVIFFKVHVVDSVEIQHYQFTKTK